MEFSAKEIISIVRKRLILIIVSSFVGLCSFYLFSQYVIKPTYTATVQMYVNTTDTTASADLNNLYYAQKVVNTYINFLQTKVFYRRVREDSGLTYTIEQLQKMTKINSVNGTEVFQISVTSQSIKDSYTLVATMQQITPELIRSIKKSAEISVVDPVTMPRSPSGPNVLLNTVTGVLLGLVLSLGMSFAWEIIDVNVKNQEELKKRYHKPLLGEIPSYETHISKRLTLYSRIFKRKNNKIRKSIIVNESQNFMINEAYKALRTNLRYTIVKEGCKKILINSPVAMDGKSTVCANLGITIAQTGARVLLLDCDLRRGRLHNFFNLKSNPGVSEILSGILKDKDVIQKSSYENLDIITMGSVPPNPTELLTGNNMEELIKNQEKFYDYIIIDSPPVNIVADALSLIKLVDGIIVVVRENRTSHPGIASALSKYELIRGNILGFVLNGITVNLNSKSKSHYYAYYKRP